MRGILIAVAMGGLMAAPSFAQDAMMADTTACADYTAMDSAGQMEAAEMMQGEAAAADASAEAMSGEDMMAAAAEACAAHPDMMVGEAMGMMSE